MVYQPEVEKDHCEKCWHINTAHPTSQDYCIDIACECHKVLASIKEPQKDWEKEFDKKFVEIDESIHGPFEAIRDQGLPVPEIKGFISNLLFNAHQEAIEECVGALEEERNKNLVEVLMTNPATDEEYKIAELCKKILNQALTTAIDKLNKKKTEV